MPELPVTQPLRDIDTDRSCRADALTSLGSCSGVGSEYYTISSTNDAVIPEYVVALNPTSQSCIDRAWVSEKTDLALQAADQPDWTRLFGKLKEIRRLDPDWNGYGSMPPNAMAEAHARDILLELHKLNRIPERVVASADDGVGIYIASFQKYAMIECYNDGAIVIGVSDREGDIRNWEISCEAYIVKAGLEEALAFLDG